MIMIWTLSKQDLDSTVLKGISKEEFKNTQKHFWVIERYRYMSKVKRITKVNMVYMVDLHTAH